MNGNFGNVFILGDSYSTYEGYIPDGYAVYYDGNKSVEEGGVSSAEKTWWGGLLSDTSSKLIMNNSWSGSTVCYTGYNGSYCYDSSFVTRIQKHLKGGICDGKKIDTVFVFGGTNDNWANAPIGEIKYENWSDEDLKSFLPAFSFLMSYLKNENKEVKVINITNTELKQEVADGMAEICRKFGIKNIVLNDIAKQNGHPNELGMKQIKEQILAGLY